MSEKKLLLLDFDGVIADTFHVAHGVAKKLCIYLTEHEYRKRFDGNIYTASKAFFADHHGDECDHDLDYWANFAPGFNTHAKPFAGMSELLSGFAKEYTLVIVSSCKQSLIEWFLDKYQLRTAIDGIYAVDTSPNKNEKIEMVCSNYSVRPKDCIFVTDTLGDINEAQGVGVSSIGVTWGFQDRETLARGNPFAIVDTPQELPAAIAKYFASLSS